MTKQEAIEFILALPRDEQAQIAHMLIDEMSKPKEPQLQKRIPGLYTGEIWVSDDFDEPLPDEFWLGEE